MPTTSPVVVQIRVALPGDARAVHLKWRQFGSKRKAPTPASLLSSDPKSPVCLVAYTESGPTRDVVGYAIYRRRGRFNIIEDLAVQPESRRQGVGTSLLNGVIELRSLGRPTVIANVAERNLAAQQFFSSVGFRAVSICYWKSGTVYRMVWHADRPAFINRLLPYLDSPENFKN